MIKRISHVGIAVREIQRSTELFSRLLDDNSPRTEDIAEQKAKISFYPVGDSSIELIQSTAQLSSVAKFVETRGEGIHHICLEVDDIVGEIQRLKNAGFQFVNEHPSAGGDGCMVAFLHPKSTNGVLVELSQPLEKKTT